MNIKPFHKMRKTWTHDDILILLSLWNDYEKELKALKRNSHIYDKIAALLRGRGVDATSSEVHFKINNLKQRFRKDELYGLTSWRYFENVREILQENKNSSQNTIKQESIQHNSNNCSNTSTNEYSVVQGIPTTKTCNASPIYDVSSSNSLSHSIPQISLCTPIPQNSSSNLIPSKTSSNSVPPNNYSNPIPTKTSATPILQNNSSSITVPSNSQSNSIRRNVYVPRPTCVVSPANESHSNVPPNSGRKKKISLKRALLEEIRRGNDIAARDQEITERLLRQANETNQEWGRLVKEFMSRTLTILEKNFAVKQNNKTV